MLRTSDAERGRHLGRGILVDLEADGDAQAVALVPVDDDVEGVAVVGEDGILGLLVVAMGGGGVTDMVEGMSLEILVVGEQQFWASIVGRSWVGIAEPKGPQRDVAGELHVAAVGEQEG